MINDPPVKLQLSTTYLSRSRSTKEPHHTPRLPLKVWKHKVPYPGSANHSQIWWFGDLKDLKEFENFENFNDILNMKDEVVEEAEKPFPRRKEMKSWSRTMFPTSWIDEMGNTAIRMKPWPL